MPLYCALLAAYTFLWLSFCIASKAQWIEIQIIVIFRLSIFLQNLHFKVDLFTSHYIKRDLTLISCLYSYIELRHSETVVFYIQPLLTQMHKDLTKAELAISLKLRDIHIKCPFMTIFGSENKPPAYFLSFRCVMAELIIINAHCLPNNIIKLE